MRHSVVLEYIKCRGCTTCIKNCPTEAIRVRRGKATILPNRCIDCGTCIRVCPHNAVKSVPDDFNALQNYQLILTAQSILGIGIIFLRCLGKPLSRDGVILLHTVSQRVQFSDPVLPVIFPLIGFFLFDKGIHGLCKPILR